MNFFFEFYNPVKIVSGNKALDNIGYELEHLGAKRPLIVTDRGVVSAGLMHLVEEAFAGSDMIIGAVYDDVLPDSSKYTVNEVARVYRKTGCDSLVAVGGGSVIDTAKGANIVITEDADDLMLFAGAETLKKPMKPFIVVPTTAGTGSETTYVAVIADPDRRVKMAFTSYHLLPDTAILDPRMTLTLPPYITAATAMDALTHSIEACICLQKNPLSDIHAKTAIRLIVDNLIPVIENDKDEKGRLMLANAACIAGAAFSNSMVGMVHALGHATGAVGRVPHGVAMNIFLPFGLEYNMEKAGDDIADLLLFLAGPDVYAHTPPNRRAIAAIAAIRGLQEKLQDLTGLPRKLREAGVDEVQFPSIAKTALNDGSLIFNPVEMDYNDAMAVLHKAF
jgi:alcohol dehydrogenase